YFVPFVLRKQPAAAMNVPQTNFSPSLLALMEDSQQCQHDQKTGCRLAPPLLRGGLATYQLRAEQDDYPRQVDPQQEQRNGSESPVDQLLAGEKTHIGPEGLFGRFEQNRGKYPAYQGMTQGHTGIGHSRVEQREGRNAENQRHRLEQRSDT